MTTPEEPREARLTEPPPIEPTGGAGTMPDDPDQSGVSQEPTPDLDEAEHAALLATVGGLTAHQILTWEASQIGTGEHPPGSNHTEYSLWGDGPWCFYFQSYGFRKYDALALIHGAHGYVPDFRGIFQPHGEFHTSNPKPGDLVAFDFNRSGEPEHIGMVEKVIGSSVIQTIEGNTSDKVMRRTRSRSYVYAYATPKYGSMEDDMQPSDKLKIGDWMKKLWSTDKTITDGTILVNTALGSGYGHSRAAHENTDDLKTMVAGLQQTVAALAANSNQLDADAVARAVLAQLSPSAIAAAVADALPADLAEQVVTELGDRIKTG